MKDNYNLLVDSREPYWIKQKFKDMSETYDDLNVKITALKTGDYCNNYFICERKELDDFISSFTARKRKDYERLKQQTGRMLNAPQPIKIFLIIGEDFSKAYSQVNEHSFNGQLAKLTALGFNVVMMSKNNDFIDYIYRLVRLSRKYTVPFDQSRLI